MMSLHGPTDVSDEGNRLYLQNCGANTSLDRAQPPPFANNDNLVTEGADTVSTVLMRPVVDTTVKPPSKRRRKPSRKARENADNSAAPASCDSSGWIEQPRQGIVTSVNPIQ